MSATVHMSVEVRLGEKATSSAGSMVNELFAKGKPAWPQVRRNLNSKGRTAAWELEIGSVASSLSRQSVVRGTHRLRDAPQDEVPNPHGEEHGSAERLEP
jgi:hypothetical protein